ncbi:MAG TPA: hypothetical protein VF199_00410 [Bacillales bacterium]
MYSLMKEDQYLQLVNNIVHSKKTVGEEIRKRKIEPFSEMEAEYGERFAKGLDLVAGINRSVV